MQLVAAPKGCRNAGVALHAIWLASHLHGCLPRIVSESIIAAVKLLLGVCLTFL